MFLWFSSISDYLEKLNRRLWNKSWVPFCGFRAYLSLKGYLSVSPFGSSLYCVTVEGHVLFILMSSRPSTGCLVHGRYPQGQGKEHGFRNSWQLCTGDRVSGIPEAGMLVGLGHCYGLAPLLVTKMNTQVAYLWIIVIVIITATTMFISKFHDTYYVPDTVLSTLHILTHLSFKSTPWGRYNYCPRSANEQMDRGMESY